VTLTRGGALDELLSGLPAAIAAGSTVITAKGARVGIALTFFDPLPCTAGYGGTVYRNGLDTSPGPPLNTAARCALPASSGVDVRGSAHAPASGAVPALARPSPAQRGLASLLGLTP
jgi:phospholipid/cholesterol/gamma-HCH transport system substrate-binding protein